LHYKEEEEEEEAEEEEGGGAGRRHLIARWHMAYDEYDNDDLQINGVDE
jgi:hypothetical protein